MKKLLACLLMLVGVNANAQGDVSLKDVQFKNLENQTVTLDQYAGKKVYLKMWASWCPICLAGLAEIDDLSADKSKDFVVLTVVSPTQNNEKDSAKFIDWYKGLDYKNVVVLLDEKGEVLKRTAVRGYPSSVILDKNLNVKNVVPGHLSAMQIKQEMMK